MWQGLRWQTVSVCVYSLVWSLSQIWSSIRTWIQTSSNQWTSNVLDHATSHQHLAAMVHFNKECSRAAIKLFTYHRRILTCYFQMSTYMHMYNRKVILSPATYMYMYCTCTFSQVGTCRYNPWETPKRPHSSICYYLPSSHPQIHVHCVVIIPEIQMVLLRMWSIFIN